MKNVAWWLNTAWMIKCLSEARAFHQATRSVAQTQAAVLSGILRNNRQSNFGRRHGFRHLRSPRDFQQSVAPACYEDFEPAVRQIADGVPGVLTAEPVKVLEPTGGSRGQKLIPYTASLRREFQRAIAVWIRDLMWHYPQVRHGRAYWSISPMARDAQHTSGGIVIGFDDDAAYLGGLERVMLRRLLAVPGGVARLPDLENSRYATLLHLLRSRDLALISIWNPTFLTALLRPIQEWAPRILHDLRHGTLSLPRSARAKIPREVFPKCRSDDSRASQLQEVFSSGLSLPQQLSLIWPALALISCWTDASAAQFVPEIRKLFPQTAMQPKGLMATEGCVSFPLAEREGAALALRSHFFEFLPVCNGGRTDPSDVCLAHQLERGGRYQVMMTTGGGLYRYRLGDLVEVVGFENQCPLIRFLGRVDLVGDLVGEKLSEMHVQEALGRAFTALGIQAEFALLVPVAQAVPRYCLYLQTTDSTTVPMTSLMATLQRALEENPHYRYAVQLGQLAPVDVQILDDSVVGWLLYERQCLARGQKAGDIKPTSLDCRPDWQSAFSQFARR